MTPDLVKGMQRTNNPLASLWGWGCEIPWIYTWFHYIFMHLNSCHWLSLQPPHKCFNTFKMDIRLLICFLRYNFINFDTIISHSMMIMRIGMIYDNGNWRGMWLLTKIASIWVKFSCVKIQSFRLWWSLFIRLNSMLYSNLWDSFKLCANHSIPLPL